MELQIDNQYFLVCGATSGFGKSVAQALLNEGAHVIGIARNEDKLNAMLRLYPEKFVPIQADLTEPDTLSKLSQMIDFSSLRGVLINAGGPPAMSFLETELENWDDAYKKLLRWKIDLIKRILPYFRDNNYGRFLLIESSSVKQPIDNLVLSTSLRSAVAGMAKTLANEIANEGITVNILAPGSHDTHALNRLIEKKADNERISIEKAKEAFKMQTGVGFLGDPDDLASLAVWLLSPSSRFVTGQTITIAGNAIKGIFG